MSLDQPGFFQTLDRMPPLNLDPRANTRAAIIHWSHGPVTKLGVASSSALAGGTVRVELGGGSGGGDRPLSAIERARLRWGRAEVVS